MRFQFILPLLAALPFPAAAQESRDLCADRPGLGTPACTVEQGRIVMEVGIGDWTRESDAESRTDTIEAGDLLLRFGLSDHLEAEIGWTAFGHARERDRATGDLSRSTGTGDIMLGLKRNLRNPDGSGVSIAVLPFVTLPTGRSAIGAGDWGAGLRVPASFALIDGVTFDLMGEVDAAVDEDRHGRHLAYGVIPGFTVDLSKALTLAAETSLMRDDDPQGHETQALLGLSLAWQAADDMQFDIGWNGGLNHDSPDNEVYLGFVQRF